MELFTSPAKGVSVDATALALLATKCMAEKGSENEEKYCYAVCSKWLENWKKYTGQTKPFQPGAVQVPGPVKQNAKAPQENTFVEGKLWHHLIYWYGLHPEHRLDRRHRDQEVRIHKILFSVGMMSHLADLVKRDNRFFNTDESVGYIECQVRQMLGAPRHRQTRLWIQKKGGQDGYQMLCDRSMALSTAVKKLNVEINMDSNEKEVYLLNLEVCNSNGDWPTGYVTEILGELDFYADVTVGGQIYSTEQDYLVSENKKHQLNVIEEHLLAQSTIYQKIGASYEQEKRNMARQLNAIMEVKRKQDERKENLKNKEKFLNEKACNLQNMIEEFHREKKAYENELERAELLNARTENKVTLNIGGKYFTTSLQTLLNVKDTFFSTMFSGRYPLKKCEDGSYFIDRDGTYFHYILEYLRTEQFAIESFDEDSETLRFLIIEVDYYNLTKMYNMISKKLRLDYEDFYTNFASMCTDIFD